MQGSFRNYTEVEIVESLRANDLKAWEFIYDRYAPLLLGKLLKMTNSKLLAGCILQKSFSTFKESNKDIVVHVNLFITLFRHTQLVAMQMLRKPEDKVCNDIKVLSKYSLVDQLVFGYNSKKQVAQQFVIAEAAIGINLRQEIKGLKYYCIPFAPKAISGLKMVV